MSKPNIFIILGCTVFKNERRMSKPDIFIVTACTLFGGGGGGGGDGHKEEEKGADRERRGGRNLRFSQPTYYTTLF